jgi:soluble epoxide hydrolase/lipid-phosphate phosphatase
LITVVTPFIPPVKEYIPLETMVKEHLPTFRYQLQLAGPDVEAKIKTKEQIKEFLNALYGGSGPNGEVGFNVTDGVLLQNLPILGPTPLLSAQVDNTTVLRYHYY